MTEQLTGIIGTDLESSDDILLGVAKMFRTTALWTDADVAIMREHYATRGRAYVRTLLPHRTDGAVRAKARELGFKPPGYKRQVNQYFTTPFIDDAIRRYYAGTPRKGGVSKIAHQMQRPAEWVYSRARQLGVVIPKFREAPWSEPEIDLLRKCARYVPQSISRKFAQHGFKRTAGAISIKLVRLRCDRTDDDHYSGTQLAELMGVRVNVVSGWIARGWLHAKTKGTTREHDVFRIHRAAVRRFIVENVGAFDIRRVEKHWFVDLVAGNS